MTLSHTPDLDYCTYAGEHQLDDMSKLIERSLSEPYTDYVYRHMVADWPTLAYCVYDRACNDKLVGCVMSKIDANGITGYLGMLAVLPEYRGHKIGSNLVRLSMKSMKDLGVDSITLETECDNIAALNLYEQLGFIRTCLLKRFYMNAADAYRLEY